MAVAGFVRDEGVVGVWLRPCGRLVAGLRVWQRSAE